MLKVWNASLVLATGVLAVLGTFLVRSGILDSIHAFGASTLGIPFVSLIALMLGGSIWLVVSRRDALRSEHRLDSLLSREAAFLLNNLVLVGLCFVVFWGTFFPLISEALTGTRASVGPPWFNRYTVPLALKAEPQPAAYVARELSRWFSPFDEVEIVADWPDELLLVGDQVYADENIDPQTRAFIESRRDTSVGARSEVADV